MESALSFDALPAGWLRAHLPADITEALIRESESAWARAGDGLAAGATIEARASAFARRARSALVVSSIADVRAGKDAQSSWGPDWTAAALAKLGGQLEGAERDRVLGAALAAARAAPPDCRARSLVVVAALVPTAHRAALVTEALENACTGGSDRASDLIEIAPLADAALRSRLVDEAHQHALQEPSELLLGALLFDLMDKVALPFAPARALDIARGVPLDSGLRAAAFVEIARRGPEEARAGAVAELRADAPRARDLKSLALAAHYYDEPTVRRMLAAHHAEGSPPSGMLLQRAAQLLGVEEAVGMAMAIDAPVPRADALHAIACIAAPEARAKLTEEAQAAAESAGEKAAAAFRRSTTRRPAPVGPPENSRQAIARAFHDAERLPHVAETERAALAEVAIRTLAAADPADHAAWRVHGERVLELLAPHATPADTHVFEGGWSACVRGCTSRASVLATLAHLAATLRVAGGPLAVAAVAHEVIDSTRWPR